MGNPEPGPAAGTTMADEAAVTGGTPGVVASPISVSYAGGSTGSLSLLPFNGGQAFELFAIPSPAATTVLALAAVALRRRR